MNLLNKIHNIIIYIIISISIIACSNHSFKYNKTIIDWNTRQNQLSQITSFQASGSLIYQSEKSKYLCHFFMDQVSNNRYQLKLTSSFGFSIFSLTVKDNSAILIDRNGNQYSDENIEQLIKKITAMDIPLKSFHNWIKGLSFNKQEDHLDEIQRLSGSTLIQDSKKWKLNIPSYKSYNLKHDKIDLPERILLDHGSNHLILKINSWKIN